jgi:hypothetical protein
MVVSWGTVFTAQHQRHRRTVALKELDSAARLVGEATMTKARVASREAVPAPR